MEQYPVDDEETAGIVGVLSAIYHASLKRVLAGLEAEGYARLSGTQLHDMMRLGTSEETFDEVSERVGQPVQILDNTMNMLSEAGYVKVRTSSSGVGSSSIVITEHGHQLIEAVNREQEKIEQMLTYKYGKQNTNNIFKKLVNMYDDIK